MKVLVRSLTNDKLCFLVRWCLRQGSTDGGLFKQIPIFLNNRYRYWPPILEVEIIGHQPSTFLSNFLPSVYIKFQNSSKIQPTNCYTLCITFLYESVNIGVLDFFLHTLWHCNSMFGQSYSAKVCT